MSIGRNIKILSFDKGITQKELARAAGFSEAMMTKIIKDERTPSVPKLMIIAEKLGVSMDELVKG